MSSPPRKHVLVVEDEALIGFDIETALRNGGFDVMGPCATVEAALRALAERRPDCAILDINLGEGTAAPVAQALAEARIPFLWLTGHGEQMVPTAHRDRPRMEKPFVRSDLLAHLKKLTPAE